MSSKKDSSFSHNLSLFAELAAIIGVLIAAIALVPAFGQWLFPVAPATATSFSSPTPVIATSLPFLTSLTPRIPALASATPRWSPTPEPNILFQDTFIDNRNGWNLKNNPGIHSTISGGWFSHSINCQTPSPADDCEYYFSLPNVLIKDFKLEIAAAICEVSRNASVTIGFTFRRLNRDFYYAYFKNNVAYLELHYGGNIDLLSRAPAPIMGGIGGINSLGLSVDGSQIQVLANGAVVLQVEDGNINKAGNADIVIFVSKGGRACVVFSDLLITGIP